MPSEIPTTGPTHREYTWKLCELCHGVAHDPDPEGWGEPCDNCAGHGGKWIEQWALPRFLDPEAATNG